MKPIFPWIKTAEAKPDLTPEEQIIENNRLLQKRIDVETKFRHLFYAGLIRGFGAAVGATVVVSLVVASLKPIAEYTIFKPMAENIIDQLERK